MPTGRIQSTSCNVRVCACLCLSVFLSPFVRYSLYVGMSYRVCVCLYVCPLFWGNFQDFSFKLYIFFTLFWIIFEKSNLYKAYKSELGWFSKIFANTTFMVKINDFAKLYILHIHHNIYTAISKPERDGDIDIDDVLHNCFGPRSLLVEGLLSTGPTRSIFYLLVEMGFPLHL